MANDLSHINKQIQKYTADIDFARRQAVNQRMMADQKGREGSPDGGTYYEHEANRFEQQAEEMENEIDHLETEKERIERHIAELEAQRAHVDREHTDRLAQLDHEITQLRGSSFML